MKRKLLAHRPSPALVIALVALISSLTGGAVAATLITGDDIARKAIAKKHIKKNAVNSKKVANGTLLQKDFKEGQFPGTGPQGLQGPRGPQGPAGEDGADGQDGAAGAPGSAKAWGLVDSTGLIRGLNATVTVGPADGLFCIKPNPAVVPDVDDVVLVASTDRASADFGYTANWDSRNNDCDDDEMTVWTGDADDTANGGSFSFVIP